VETAERNKYYFLWGSEAPASVKRGPISNAVWQEGPVSCIAAACEISSPKCGLLMQDTAVFSVKWPANPEARDHWTQAWERPDQAVDVTKNFITAVVTTACTGGGTPDWQPSMSASLRSAFVREVRKWGTNAAA
jgi:hypothetical protein